MTDIEAMQTHSELAALHEENKTLTAQVKELELKAFPEAHAALDLAKAAHEERYAKAQQALADAKAAFEAVEAEGKQSIGAATRKVDGVRRDIEATRKRLGEVERDWKAGLTEAQAAWEAKTKTAKE